MKSFYNIAGKKCIVYAGEQPRVLLVQPVGEHENETLDAQIEAIREAVDTPFVFVGVPISDWEKELTPWSDPNISPREGVGEYAFGTLDYITEQLLPYLRSRWERADRIPAEEGANKPTEEGANKPTEEGANKPAEEGANKALPVILGGYSLAGLFARWAASEAECFDAVAAASPSLWITSWQGFSEAHQVFARDVYLSLGDREERARNKVMAQVGDNIRWEYEHLQRTLGANHCTLVWEQGGHFTTPHLRLARAFAWCINRIQKG